MYPKLFNLPYFETPVFSYGVMMVLGFFLGMQLAKFLARRSGQDPEVFVNAAIIALVAGVIGARLSHVLENIGQYTDASRSAWANFKDAVNIREGGLTFYGGFLLAFPACVGYGLYKRVPIRLGMDIIAPCLMVGLGFGRIGCFLNGCCYGAACDVPGIAVTYPYHSNAYLDQVAHGRIYPSPRLLDPETGRLLEAEVAMANSKTVDAAREARSLPVHPAQLYSAFNAFLIAAVLSAFFTLPHAPGRVMALLLILKGITRFLLEMLRSEPAVLGPLSFSMVVSIGLVIAGVALWWVFGKFKDAPARGFPVVAAPATA